MAAIDEGQAAGDAAPLPRLLVTRPEPQASTWTAALRARGVPAKALPLIAIGPPPDLGPVRAAHAALDSYALVVFVSPAAVAQFCAAAPGLAWPPAVRATATGPGTAASLLAAGVPKGCIVSPPPESARFDSEALWELLRAEAWQGRRVLLVRGNGGRDWLADTLRAAGALTEAVQAYARAVPDWTPAQRFLATSALARPAEHAYLFSSGEAIETLAALQPGADRSVATALATHPRIAAQLRAAGWGRVIEAPPTIDGVIDALTRAARDPSIQSRPPS